MEREEESDALIDMKARLLLPSEAGLPIREAMHQVSTHALFQSRPTEQVISSRLLHRFLGGNCSTCSEHVSSRCLG